MAREKIRVLHLVHWLTTGGMERWLLNMFEEADREQFQIDVCCKGGAVGALAPLAESLGVRVWHNPLDWTHARYALRLRELIREQRYDIIHSHLGVYAGVPALVAKAMRVPTILSFHNTSQASDVVFHPALRALRDLYASVSLPVALRSAQIVTGCSEGVVQAIVGSYRVRPAKTRVLYYGVETAPLLDGAQRAEVRASLGVPAGAPFILHIGRFAPQKNHAGLVAIAAGLLRRHPEAVFGLVGDGPLRPSVEAQIGERGLAASFRVLGLRSDVERILRAADILVLPSLWEGLPVVSLEANAAGLPVVASNLRGMAEAIVDGENGLLLPLDSTAAFVEALDLLIRDDELRARLGAQGRLRVIERFSRRASAQRLNALYDELLSPRLGEPALA